MEYYHLTTPQQNIWNLQKYYADTAIANLCGAIFFPERRDSAKLQQAVCQFIQSQSGIRLRFCEKGEPLQYVSDEVDEVIPVLIFQSREEMNQYAKTFAREPVGLLDRQMYRFVVFHLEKENRSGILVTLSHLVADAWTFGLMANQVELAYHRLNGETESALSEGDYIDFIHSEEQYLESERYEKDQRYWEEKYAVCPEECPVKMRSVLTDAAKAERITKTLPVSLEENIAAYCGKYPVTQAVLFETALVVYLFHVNPDIQSVTIGVPVLNRSGKKEKTTAGMFVSTMPLTVEV
ncbi:MAG: condensation domain-containing protein, partial [Clostridium sp.]|nr:condensation domain-containing protein [Clostridium sp.]